MKSPVNKITVEVIDNLYEFQKYDGLWRSLTTTSGTNNPFLTRGWIQNWLDFKGDVGRGCLVLGFRSGQFIAGGVFAVHGKTLKFFSDPFFADYAGIAALEDGGSVMHEMVKTIIRTSGCHTVDLQTIPGNCDAHKILIAAVSEVMPHSVKINVHENPFITLSKDFSSYYGKRKKSLRSEMTRTKNQLNKKVRNHRLVVATDEADRIQIYEALVKFHLARQNDKVGTSIFSTKKNIEFFRSLVLRNENDFVLELAGIMADGKYISASLSILYKNTCFYWIPSFDKDYVKGSLGNYHLYNLIKHHSEVGTDIFDFMGGEEAYKLRWNTDSYSNFRILGFSTKQSYYSFQLRQYLYRQLRTYKNHPPLRNFWWLFSKVIR